MCHQPDIQRTTSRSFVQIALLMAIAMLAVSCGGDGDNLGKTDRGVPLIFAAASLADVLGEAASLYEAETGKRVDFSFGGSIALANQIALFGAPADGVFFVGEVPAEVIADAGLVPASGYPNIFSNSLVVIGPSDAARLGSLGDIASKEVRFAIADPLLAPAGVYARQALETIGIWDEISGRAILMLDVRAAMAAVESGNVRFGIVYKTDAVTSDDISVVYEIEDGHSPISYMAIPLEGASNKDGAAEFLQYIVFEQEARNLFELAGFTIVGVPGQPDPGK
jgi:molybdate transport system substrate-binding protein